MPHPEDNENDALESASREAAWTVSHDLTTLMATSPSSSSSNPSHADRAYSRWRPPLLQGNDEKATAFHATLAKLNAIDADTTDTRTAILEEATAYLTSQLTYFCFEHINDLLLFDIRLSKYPANTGHEIYNYFHQKINMERDVLLSLIAAMVFNLPDVVDSLLNGSNANAFKSSVLKVYKNFNSIILEVFNFSISLLNYDITDLFIDFINKSINKDIEESNEELSQEHASNRYFLSQHSSPVYEAMQTNEVMTHKIIETKLPYFFKSENNIGDLLNYICDIYHPKQLELINYLYTNNLAFFKISDYGFIIIFNEFPFKVQVPNRDYKLNPYNQAVFNLIIKKLLDCLENVYGADWYNQKLIFNTEHLLSSDPIRKKITPETYGDYAATFICSDLSYLDADNQARLRPAAIAIISRLEAQAQTLKQEHSAFTDYVKNRLIPVHGTLPIPSPLMLQLNVNPNYHEFTSSELLPMMNGLDWHIIENQWILLSAVDDVFNVLRQKRQQLITEHPSLVNLHRRVLNNPLTEIHFDRRGRYNALKNKLTIIQKMHDDILSLTQARISRQYRMVMDQLREENRQLTGRIALLTRTSTCPSALFPSSSSGFDYDGIPINATTYNHAETSDSGSDNETNRRPRKHERPHDSDSDFSEGETQTPKYGCSGHSSSS